MKEYFYRRYTNLKNQPWRLILTGICLGLLIGTGPFAPFIQIVKSSVVSLTMCKTEMEYFLPRTPKDMKKERLGMTYGMLLEAIIGLLISIPSVFLMFHNSGQMFLEEPFITALFYLAILAIIYRIIVCMEVGDEGKKSKGKRERRLIRILGNLGHFLEPVVAVNFVFWLNGNMVDYFLQDNKWFAAGIDCIAIILLSLDAIIKAAKWNLGDGDYRY